MPCTAPDRIAEITIRSAVRGEETRIASFQAESLRMLACGAYTPAVIDQFIADVGTMPADLISSGRLFVLESQGEIVATGGWCWRQANGEPTSHRPAPNDDADDPEQVSVRRGNDGTVAEITAIYVDPIYTRTGLASWLLGSLEADIARTGINTVRIAATLNGLPLCQRNGYRPYRIMSLRLSSGAAFATIGLVKSVETSGQSGGVRAHHNRHAHA